MHDKFKNIFLKLIALLCVYLLYHAPAAGARALFFKAPTQLLHVSAGITAILLGFAAALLIEKGSRSLYLKLCTYATPLIPAASFYLLLDSLGMPRAAYEAAIITIFWFFGIRGHYLSYDSIINFFKFFPSVLLNGAVLYISFYFHAEFGYLSSTVFLFFYFFLILFFILQNQANIDDALERKGVKSSVALKKIRSFNIIIVLCMFAAIPLLMNLKTVITFTARSAGTAIQQLVELASQKDDDLPSKEETQPGGTSQNDQSHGNDPKDEAPAGQPEKPESEGSSSGDAGKENNGTGSGDHEDEPSGGNLYVKGDSENSGPRIVIIASFLAAMVLTWAFVIWLTKSGRLKRFFGGVHYIVKKYFAKLRMYLKKFLFRYNVGIIRGEDYTDEVEFTDEKPEDEYKGRTNMQAGINSRNRDKRLRPVFRIRRLYSLILKAISARQIKISSSDTTGQILIRSSEKYPFEQDMGKMTQIYNQVRYGDLIPDESNLSEAEASYSSIMRTLKEKS